MYKCTVKGKKTGLSKINASKPNDKCKTTLYTCSVCNDIFGTTGGLKLHSNTCIGEAVPLDASTVSYSRFFKGSKRNAAPGGNQDNPKVKKKVSSKTPPKMLEVLKVSNDIQEVVSIPASSLEGQSVMLSNNIHEIVGIAGSSLEGQSVMLASEAIGVPPQTFAILNVGSDIQEIVGIAGSSLEGQSVLLTSEAIAVPVQKSSILNYNTVSTAGSDVEKQSTMLSEEIVSKTGSCLEGQSVPLTCEAIGSNAAPDEDQDNIKVKETVPSESKETGFSEIDASKSADKAKRVLYMCSDCRYICGSLLSMKKHKKTCTGEKGPSKKELPADLKTSMYVCPECDFYCVSDAKMKLHYINCNGGICLGRNWVKISIACQTDCHVTNPPVILKSRPFSSTDADDVPLPEGKMSTECQTEPVTITPERTYCTYCNYSSTRVYNLHKHMQTHSDEKHFPCSYCEKRFKDKQSLKVHERTHTGERPYACDICERAFNTSMARNKHKIRLHTNERPFVCDYCHMSFKLKDDLKSHIRTHSSKIYPGTKQYKKTQ